MRAWMDVATLTKSNSRKGRFVAKCAANLPCVLEQGMEVAFVPPRTGMPREGVVEEVVPIDSRRFEVRFAGLDDRAVADALVGSHCLVRREQVTEALGEQETPLVAGWRVINRDGFEVGLVTCVRDNPAHDLLEVEGPDGKLHLIPVVDEFIVDVREQDGVVIVDLPSGLLDL